ncbi:hypothetical protein JAAARDRAFT_119446 [Jaapia argillacea MUCL 33604]|uniref:Rab-GAP TBC domain-containing protein n=1 Tax=Jaapia argillacea MUCL 33604 TaxID=933084 RepID=A0A067Q838_9AGAM|nr:hypothetical protein JAAARDRAFT_119446 [Jaapia argillacea MUCL 33604]
MHSDDDLPSHSKFHESLNFDDAFSEGDDAETFEFSSEAAAIRHELSKNLGWLGAGDDDVDDLATKIGLSEDPNQSISTIDLDGTHGSVSPSTHSSPHLESPPERSPSPPGSTELASSLENDFSQVSLGNGHHQTDSQQTDNSHDQEPTHEEDTPHSYPVVHIDASNTHGGVEVEVVTSPTTPAFSHDPPSVEHAPPRTPSPTIPPITIRQSWTPPSSPPATSSNTAPSSPRTPQPSSHRPTRSHGPSMLDKVVSKTRPSFLPPKSRTEDKKHMADWEAMMKRSRAAEEKRRKALEERRLEREREVEESLHVWEKIILPDWRIVNRNPALRRLWWSGIPTKLRATMWEHAVGNPLALSKDSYRTCLARAKRAIAAGTFPTTTISLMEDDIFSTLPSLHIFRADTGPLYQDLKDLLCAWVVSRSDEGLGYVGGISKVAGMFLINMAPPQAFVVMRNLLERHCLRSFYGGMAAKDDVEAYYRIFDTLLADGMPKIYFNFKQHQISPAAYLPDWLLPLFLDHLPFEACARIWDVLLLEGDSFLYRAALAILAVLEPRLFFPDRRELLELLRGENKAALEVAKRDGRPLDGGKYEIYGVDEETLWDRIDSMDEWWKESTWTRLIQRELPDL